MQWWKKERRGDYAWILGLVAAALVTDRLAKVAAETWLEGREPLRFAWDTVVFVFARNEGAFLGLGGQWPEPIKWVLLFALPLGLCLYGLWWCWAKETERLRLIGIVCLVGGGLGNLLDRAFLGFQVVDFLNFGIGPLRTGIVNVADLFVTLGAILVFVHASRTKDSSRETTREPTR